MLKINNKYIYIEKIKKPNKVDFENESDFLTAKAMFDFESFTGGLVSTSSVGEKVKLKTTKLRLPRIEIKEGSTIYIERWDGNGIPHEVKVVSVKKGKSRAIVKTDKGFFVFSIWNSKRDDIEFTWTCKGKGWEKRYKKWIDGDRYFLR